MAVASYYYVAFFTVLKSQNNVGAMKDLVSFASQQLYDNRYFHIGSSCLWNHHVQSVNKMAVKLHRFKVKEVRNIKIHHE